MTAVRIATRGSDLALWQARYVAGRIERELGEETEIIVLTTTGDKIQDISLAKIGGKGLFVKEIEEALLDDRADVAVHSGKDLPAVLAEGLVLAAFPQREDPRDALVGGPDVVDLGRLRPGARVGTGSTRRIAQLLACRGDLEIVPLRGNVPTRIGKLETERLDAVVLACAGLDRLGLSHRVSERISTDLLLPAVCQGTLAIQARESDPLAKRLGALGDSAATVSTAGERGFLTRMEGDCTVPMAAFVEPLGADRIRLRGLLASESGDQILRAEVEAAAVDAERAGVEVADRILADGGKEILAALAAEAE